MLLLTSDIAAWKRRSSFGLFALLPLEGMIGREVGEDVEVNVVIRGSDTLTHPRVLRLAQHVSQSYLVAVLLEVDAYSNVTQRLTAGSVALLYHVRARTRCSEMLRRPAMSLDWSLS